MDLFCRRSLTQLSFTLELALGQRAFLTANRGALLSPGYLVLAAAFDFQSSLLSSLTPTLSVPKPSLCFPLHLLETLLVVFAVATGAFPVKHLQPGFSTARCAFAARTRDVGADQHGKSCSFPGRRPGRRSCRLLVATSTSAARQYTSIKT